MSARIRAFSTHLSISLIIASICLLLVYFVWYPSPYHTTLAVTHIFLILMGADITIGPLMTLLVYKPGKKYLKLDMFIIVTIQAAAFIYGMHTVTEARPAWLVFNLDRFDLVKAHEIDRRKLNNASPEYRNAPWFGPQWVAAKSPDDVEARNKILFESIAGGFDVPQMPELYYPLEKEAETIKKIALPLNELNLYNKKQDVQETIKQYPKANAWLPMNSSGNAMVVLLDKDSGSIISTVNLNPWD